MNYFRDLTNDECKIYDSWINQESIKTGENLFNDSKPKTNGDRIRQMTDEELAEFLDELSGCRLCDGYKRGICNNECLKGHIAWLRKEVSGDEHTEGSH